MIFTEDIFKNYQTPVCTLMGDKKGRHCDDEENNGE